jgi:CO/xanthine dehydrogenase Mo-binding subunit
VEIRLKNLFGEGSIGPTGTPMPPGVGIRETLIAAARVAGWREADGHWIKPQLPPPSAPHKRRGIGLACAYKNVAYSFGFDDKSGAEVILHLDEAGEIERIVVKIGACDVGEGVTTVLTQIAAQVLGVPLERIEVAMPDTAAVPDAGSTSASRQTYVSGNAVRLACEKARQAWREALEAKKGEREIRVYHLFRTQDVRPTTPFDPETGFCWPHVSYGYATQIAEVEVDVETGEVEVTRLIAAHDVGRAINPTMLEGQISGGVHMGLGYALMERYIQEGGRIQTRNLGEYLIPTVLDMPRQIEPLIVEVPDPGGPFGAKGVGEMPTLPTAPAILAAIHDAVGVWIDELPATPERVLAATRETRRHGDTVTSPRLRVPVSPVVRIV